MSRERVLVGLSGGLDSAYAASKLIRLGYEVEGAAVIMHEYTSVEDAEEAASSLGIPFHKIDARELFNKSVKDYFVKEYSLGRTPNPCVVCNREVKLKALADYARERGFDKIATGHYSRVVKRDMGDGERYTLVLPEDVSKDQTYMLSLLPQSILGMLLLPLSEETKEQIRLHAREIGIDAADKEESQEICFLPDGNYPEYIEQRLGKFPEGDFVTEKGEVIGRHKGIIRYTLGQRKGLGVSWSTRLFVTDINTEENKITLSEGDKKRQRIALTELNFLGRESLPEGEKIRVEAQLRYRARKIPATFFVTKEGEGELLLDEPAGAVALGQFGVLYLDGEVLLSGTISRAE